MARAIVIGTGVGGSGIAALLAGAGYEVTVFERNEFPGGKTSMYERDGFRVDMSVHVSPRGDRGPIGQLARRLEADLELRMCEPWRLIVGGRSCRLPLAFTRPTALVRIALLIGAKPYNAIGALRLFRKVLSVKEEADLAPYFGKPASEFISSYTKDPNVYIFLNIMGGITRCDDVAKGLLEVRKKMGLTKPTVIRLVGTNEEEGRKILQEAGIPSLETMEDAAAKAVELAKGAK